MNTALPDATTLGLRRPYTAAAGDAPPAAGGSGPPCGAGARIDSRLRSLRHILGRSPFVSRLLPVTESVALPPKRREASRPNLNGRRPTSHRLHYRAPSVRGAKLR